MLIAERHHLTHIVADNIGHTQQEHETSHGSMTETRWSIEGSDGTGIELEGRKFSSDDEGAPMMCNLICSSMGRHVHIEYCRTEEGEACSGDEIQHINARMIPDPDKPKDSITHRLYWSRMGLLDSFLLEFPETESSLAGFKGSERLPLLHECVPRFATDPYTHDEQAKFKKWCVVIFGNVALLNFLSQRCHVLWYGRSLS